MMKKLACLLLALASVGCMAACKNEAKMKLNYGEKYIHSDDIAEPENEQIYYVFYRNGTGEYHYYNYSEYAGRTSSYTISFRYKIVEEENMIFAFYDGIEYDEVDTAKSFNDSTTIYKLMYSQDFLMSATTANIYMTQDFIDSELPNFGEEIKQD